MNIDLELKKLKEERKEALQDLVMAVIMLTILTVLAFIVVFQSAEIDNLEKENYRLNKEVERYEEE